MLLDEGHNHLLCYHQYYFSWRIFHAYGFRVECSLGDFCEPLRNAGPLSGY